jgi:hypothetical protein
MLKEFKGRRKDYNHYTEKIKKLEKIKEESELNPAKRYSPDDFKKLLRVGIH